jgi:uncharacterized protein
VSVAQCNQVLAALLRADGRMAMLRALARMELPDAWIAAGAVRNAVWDTLHGFEHSTPLTDVDVIWFNAQQCGEAQDRRLELRLHALLPGIPWSVKNQARMNRRNGDSPYADCPDAMRYWPETATCVAARLAADDSIELHAAYGFADLLDGVLRPTPRFAAGRTAVFHARIVSKRWQSIWPRLTVGELPDAEPSAGQPGEAEDAGLCPGPFASPDCSGAIRRR